MSVFFFLSFSLSELYNFTYAWSRNGNDKYTLKIGNPYSEFQHTGVNDYAVSTSQVVNVTFGTIYNFTCEIAATGSGTIQFSTIGYSSNGTLLAYESVTDMFEDRSNTIKTYTASFFTRNPKIAYISPRLIGEGAVKFRYGVASMSVTGSFDADPNVSDKILENSKLKLLYNITTNTISVFDKRVGRNYVQPSVARVWGRLITKITPLENGFNVSAMQISNLKVIYTSYWLNDDEIQVEIQRPDGNYDTFFNGFENYDNESIILPHGEGMIFPINHNLSISNGFAGYTGHGISMGFYGVAAYKNNSDGVSGCEGYMIILQTVDDAQVIINKASKDVPHQWIRIMWVRQKDSYAYNRRYKMVFFENGGHVAMAKRYQKYAKEIGLYKSFKQKIEENPNLEESLNNMRGAANIWLYENIKKIYAEMQDNFSMKYILASYAYGSDIEFCNNRSIVSSRYDIYQDAMDPNTKYDISWHPDWVNESYEREQLVMNEDGTLRTGWSVYPKGSTELVYCNVVSDRYWLDYMREKINKEIKNGDKRTCRFIDVATASAWYEDYSPKHPSNRTLSKHFRKLTLGALHNEYNFVSGSETGIDQMVPEVDYFEGMMSLPNFRVDDAGRNTAQIIYGKPPEQITKFQVGERYRLPLWELVYHDCTIAYWYWGDFNNKLPAVWRKRDLFNALYGVPPMYQLNNAQWQANKSMFAESYHIASPVAHETMFSEMTDHKILTTDWSVQQTHFSNGVVSTVNFGNSPYVMNDGYVLEPMTNRIQRPEEGGLSTVGIVLIVVAVVVVIAVIAVIVILSFKQGTKVTMLNK
ncbi:Carbohydrate binding domain protein [Histomonas meleagridis]|uniref:Carbohydrate binding domain protein n=1 Tax=Histomonas meleagridis TaxID=135588 RepID=UPI003559F628|nr:Carbohydrate binding domain protein [Histomonas meleagridis]KAH0802353.1 Carbohydrate binding domain protein [Histomonas meleagridis]